MSSSTNHSTALGPYTALVDEMKWVLEDDHSEAEVTQKELDARVKRVFDQTTPYKTTPPEKRRDIHTPSPVKKGKRLEELFNSKSTEHQAYIPTAVTSQNDDLERTAVLPDGFDDSIQRYIPNPQFIAQFERKFNEESLRAFCNGWIELFHGKVGESITSKFLPIDVDQWVHNQQAKISEWVEQFELRESHLFTLESFIDDCWGKMEDSFLNPIFSLIDKSRLNEQSGLEDSPTQSEGETNMGTAGE